ncbi:MAG: tRNA lysidine(34) synthetase TilS [Flavobacteriaceae bacterium]|nr:tRNA lysidine(34) synthetase TilS [Flavobacteriaceae bacterium]
MLKAFQDLLNNRFPFLKDTPLLLAVSGGLDSMVLTDLCVKSGLNIALAHCNFKLRAQESDGDEDFIKDFAQKNHLEVFTTHFETETFATTTKQSIQMAARQLRYEWFDTLKYQNGFEYILTAHHADDNLETVLINLSRGTGLEGLTGIPELNGSIVRPLLKFSREDIHNFATHHKLSWREDSSNNSTKYVRNNLRHTIIPLLKNLNPSFIESFQKTQNHLKDTQSILEDYMLEIEDKVIESIDENQIVYNIDKILSLNNPKAYLYQLLKVYNFTDWTQITALLEAQSGKQISSSTHRLLKNRSHLILTPLSDFSKDSISIEASDTFVSIPNQPFDLKLEIHTAIGPTSKDVLYLDFELLQFPLQLSHWNAGDYFYPSGMNGKKKLSKYFKDEKFSLVEKENTVVLYSKNAVVWIVGMRADKRFMATTSSTKILKLSIDNAHS